MESKKVNELAKDISSVEGTLSFKEHMTLAIGLIDKGWVKPASDPDLEKDVAILLFRKFLGEHNLEGRKEILVAWNELSPADQQYNLKWAKELLSLPSQPQKESKEQTPTSHNGFLRADTR